MIRPAVGALPRGSAFAVTDRHVLTCWHCVAGQELPFPLTLAPGVVVEVVCADHDSRLDVALLELRDRLPEGWRPVPLGAGTDVVAGRQVLGLGWPLSNPSRSDPMPLPAEVALPLTSIHDGQPVIQLYSRQVAARLRPRGFSGGPVLVDTLAGQVAVGVVRWMQEEDEDRELAVGGTVYAAPVAEILRRWPQLAAGREGAAELAGDADAPHRLRIANFLDGHVRGRAGELPFAGRDDAFRSLDAWLADPDGPPYHLLTGNAGTGKSTLLARWALARPAGRTVFVPVSQRYELTGAGEVYLSLLHRLARIHGVPYDYSADRQRAHDALSALLARPAPDGRPLLVIVDALDEAGWEPGAADFPRLTGAGVRVVLSARHTSRQPSGAAWLERLDLPSAAVTTLGPLSESDLGELIEQVRPGAGVLAARLWELSRGDPVTASLYLRDLDRLDSAAVPGLAGFFDTWWKGLWPRLSGKKTKDARRVLNVLATAEGPVRLAELRGLVGRTGKAMDGERVREALRFADRLVLQGGQPDSFVIAHPLIGQVIRERLAESGELDSYRDAYVVWGVSVLEALLARELAPPAVPAYLVRHLAAHLTESHRAPLATAMGLTHTLWRRTRESSSDDLDGYRSDVRRVRDRARAANQRAFEAGEPLPCLPEQVVCAAALAGERAAVDSEMSHHLAAQLVRHGRWPPGRALSLLTQEYFPNNRCSGIVSLVRYLDVEHLPALRRILETTVADSALYEEFVTVACAAYARRLLELGRPEEALAVADLVPPDHRYHGRVRVWVLAELIPLLPAGLAEQALIAAVEQVVAQPEPFAATRLTKQVPVAAAVAAGVRDDLVAALSPFLYGDSLREREFVAAARWLPREDLDEILARALTPKPHLPLRAGLLPALNYDGLFSVLPPEYAAWAAELVDAELTGGDREQCLFQLLPMLDESRWEPRELSVVKKLDEPQWEWAGPYLRERGRVGEALRVLAESRDYWPVHYLAPWMSPADVELALELFAPDPSAAVEQRPIRRWVLARLAEFGPAEADRALDLLYEKTEWKGLPGSLQWLLSRCLPDPVFEPNGRAALRRPWWQQCTFPGVQRQWRGGMSCWPDEDMTALRAREAAEVAELAGSVQDPWAALTVLAAGPPELTGEVLARLRALRESTPTHDPLDGFPRGCPWLVRGIGDWTPSFVRMLTPEASALVKPILFHGGYLEGVPRVHHFFGDHHLRLDDWAHDVLALTPILTVAELDALLALRRGEPEVKSESTRKALETAIGSALAGHGHYERAYELVGGASWQSELLRISGMADILPQLPAAELGEWLAQVHQIFHDPTDRGSLWSLFQDRWPELSRAGLWRAVDRWTAELPHDSRFGVLADVLLYRYAIVELGGAAESARLLDLIT
ncbi:serine protease [Nonomuraea sp. PA05]|uniref:serine protease n=1 Tax=Nonomuraea sp. PA05 TaxID=2604466 RepID=UPI001651BFD6|nr:serine protease [Nonomuraea sp. PA05]